MPSFDYEKFLQSENYLKYRQQFFDDCKDKTIPQLLEMKNKTMTDDIIIEEMIKKKRKFLIKNMTTAEKLKEGECAVVTKDNTGYVRDFTGYFNNKYPCIFFAIPAQYEIIGYVQHSATKEN